MNDLNYKLLQVQKSSEWNCASTLKAVTMKIFTSWTARWSSFNNGISVTAVHFGPHSSIPQYPLRIKRALSWNYHLLMTPEADPGGSRRFDGYRFQGSLVRIPLRDCVFVSCVCCESSGLCNGLVTRSEEKCRLCECVCVWEINLNKQAACAPDGQLRQDKKKTENPHD